MSEKYKTKAINKALWYLDNIYRVNDKTLSGELINSITKYKHAYSMEFNTDITASEVHQDIILNITLNKNVYVSYSLCYTEGFGKPIKDRYSAQYSVNGNTFLVSQSSDPELYNLLFDKVDYIILAIYTETRNKTNMVKLNLVSAFKDFTNGVI